jgi:hypothetical protein
VKAAKVVAGLEPELTNVFLIEFADCAINSGIDNTEAVQRCLGGELPGSRPPPMRPVTIHIFFNPVFFQTISLYLFPFIPSRPQVLLQLLQLQRLKAALVMHHLLSLGMKSLISSLVPRLQLQGLLLRPRCLVLKPLPLSREGKAVEAHVVVNQLNQTMM